MGSFVVRIDDMNALLHSWDELLRNHEGYKRTWNKDACLTLNQKWPRIKFMYYCDDYDGNTIRIYDTEHFNHFGGSHYLEPDGHSKGHYERVIIRGKNMWSGDQTNPDSLKERFRNNPAWQRFRAKKAPLRTGGTTNIYDGPDRGVRLRYFESVNQPPPKKIWTRKGDCPCGAEEPFFGPVSPRPTHGGILREQDDFHRATTDIAAFFAAVQSGRRNAWIAQYFTHDEFDTKEVGWESELLDWDVIDEIIDNYQWRLSLPVVECEKCGRLRVRIPGENSYRSFSPDEPGYAGVLRSHQ